MGVVTAALIVDDASSLALVETLAGEPSVGEILVVNGGVETDRLTGAAKAKSRVLEVAGFPGAGINRVLDETRSRYLLVVVPGELIEPGQRAIERMVSVAADTGAGLVYSDFRDEIGGEIKDHPLIDCQPGSIRDSFDFGSMLLISRQAAAEALAEHGAVDERLKWGGFYDLRLKLSLGSSLIRIPEPLYTRTPMDRRASGERQFDYVDPRKRDYQIEMEQVATDHLKRTGAYLRPEFEPLVKTETGFPVKASVIIPVRNRERTIKEAVLSALNQKTDFDFNVIVVDNHSTDDTTRILAELARENSRLVHRIPNRTDLGIGGCWNEAVYSAQCGQYAAQLDSDDLYTDERVLERIVAKFDDGPYAMVVGSYTIVNFDLQEIPPGLIDHREWTRENGRNNALRINGLGAPRAFYVPALRQFGVPNTSYGEDYAVALRITRHYEIGRIYESIYYARRWEGNSDAQLALAASNRHDTYKDRLRTVEILARQRMNKQ